MIHFYLIIHLIAAAIWVGGHIILLLGYLPKALREKNTKIIESFEKKFEPIGIPALLVQIITGILMAYHYNITISNWFSFSNSIEKVISLKLILLFITLGLAIHARIFIIPKLSAKNLAFLALHIILINLIAITMLALGTFIRYGGI
ncbi:MAG: copper resistance protein CopD [Ferruginibacter sp.]|nr:copper resistance protein CopD [Ferruginibacter sp.]